MLRSDVISGLVLIGLGSLSLNPLRSWSLWGIALVGLWLQLAPIFFWCPQVVFYLNDTLVGVILIALSFTAKETSPSGSAMMPSGWSYNPSDWIHRIPTVGLAFMCWFFSRYMAAFQLGYIDHMWDPLFGDGTLRVITSTISKSFPVSDAGMGAICYTLEAILGWQGDEERWHKMPWLVLVFGILVVPVGIASITLIILQPVAVGAWCGWCLGTAAGMLLMIVLTGGELIAVLQFLRRSVKSGKGLWTTLWKGSQGSLGNLGERAPSHGKWGVTLPWNLVLTTLCGVWLMSSPHFFNAVGVLATGNYVEGPLLVAISIIAMAEVFRAFRYLHVLLGLGLIATAWMAPELSSSANLNNYVVGVLLILLALPKGKVNERYGNWNKLIF